MRRSTGPGARIRLALLTATIVVTSTFFPGISAAVPGPPSQTQCGVPVFGGPTCFAVRRRVGTDQGPGSPALGPADLRSAYGLPTNGGAGATIAIVAATDAPRAESDLAQYRHHFGLPSCTSGNGCFRKVDQRGGTQYPRPDAGWAGEIAVDLDMVSATAPLAHLILVEADWASFSNMGAAVDLAVRLGAGYVVNGYGGAETPTEAADLDRFYRHPGVTIVAAAGNGGDGVQYPAASPYLTAVGGTSLIRKDNPRGWSETVWHNGSSTAGSGCSRFEAKPAWQTDRGCATRTVADVSAVADPATGVAVYQSYGNGSTGWSVYGGTSVAASIITGVYAVAGKPVAGTFPAAYPYAARAALNDVTSGTNGTCAPAYLCTGGVGFDGPTGLGTPHGVAAFSAGPHGELTGTVTDAATHAGLADAAVSVGPYPTRTDALGHYDIGVPVGTYAVAGSAYGYLTSRTPGVAAPAGRTVTRDMALTPLPQSTIRGTVTDGSGHGWPLYARIAVDGVPGGPVYTDPATGRYTVSLPQQRTYQLLITAVYKGYAEQRLTVVLGGTEGVANVRLLVDPIACTAAGYAVHNVGTTERFEAGIVPPGWKVGNGAGKDAWQFTDKAGHGNLTSGRGGYAIVDGGGPLSRQRIDTTLTLPPANFSSTKIPLLGFDTYVNAVEQLNSVELSVDNGATWTVPWQIGPFGPALGSHVDLYLTQAAGQANTQVRFHFLSNGFNGWWEVDNVFIGRHNCDLVPGGLVLGFTDDANTRAGVDGATIASTGLPAIGTTSAATPDDPNLGDGFYWFFSPGAAVRQLTASRSPYASATATATVRRDGVTRADLHLRVGQITVSPGAVGQTVVLAGTTSQTLTVTNSGSAPATVHIGSRSGAFQPLSRLDEPERDVNGPATVGTSWVPAADYPTPIQDNRAAFFDGKVYAGFGYDGHADTAALYVYDPRTDAWTTLAAAADPRSLPVVSFLGRKLYVVGGWNDALRPDPKTEVYDPATNHWSTAAANPHPFAAAGSAVLNGKLYVVGGCDGGCGRAEVEIYNPASNRWTAGTPYPEPISWASCGTIAGSIYCAGGLSGFNTTAHTYQYDPTTDRWNRRADLPMTLTGAATATSGQRLLLSGGLTNTRDPNAVVSNEGFSYDPAADAWTRLPDLKQAADRAAGACGFFQIGGATADYSAQPLAVVQLLPGHTDCTDAAEVPWLTTSATTLTVPAHGSVRITVTLHAGGAAITQPGNYRAQLVFITDTPYLVPAVNVRMTVTARP